MAKKNTINPISVSVGAAVMASALAMTPLQASSENPFASNDLHAGFMIADKGMDHAKGDSDNDSKGDAEGKCGEAKCGEGKCGANKEKKEMKEKSKEGKCGEESDS